MRNSRRSSKNFIPTKRRGIGMQRRTGGSPSGGAGLMQQETMIVPVFLPAILAGFGADVLLVAVADGLELVRGYAALCQGLMSGIGASFAQGQVVHGGPAFVAVALNPDLPVGVCFDDFGGMGQRLLRLGTQISFVVIEVDVLDGLGKELFLRQLRWRRGRRGAAYSHGSRGVLGAASAFCGQVIRGCARRGNGLGTAGVDLVALKGNIGRVLGAPGQGGGLAALN